MQYIDKNWLCDFLENENIFSKHNFKITYLETKHKPHDEILVKITFHNYVFYKLYFYSVLPFQLA